MEPLREATSHEIDPRATHVRLPRNRVLVLMRYQPRSATLWTPDERRAILGEVVLVGLPVRNSKGVELPQHVAVGDTVVVSPFVGVEIQYAGKEALIFREDEVLAVMEKSSKEIL